MCTSLTNTLIYICTEGKAVEWEEQLKFSEIQLKFSEIQVKPILINDIDLKAKVSNLYQFRTSTTQSVSTPSLQSHSIPTSTVKNTMNSRDELQRCSSWPPKFLTLTFTLTFRNVTFVWSPSTSMWSLCSFIPATDVIVQLVSAILTKALRDIFTEGKAVQWEDQLDFSEIKLNPIVINDLDLKAKVLNHSSCITSSKQSIIIPWTFYSKTLYQWLL